MSEKIHPIIQDNIKHSIDNNLKILNKIICLSQAILGLSQEKNYQDITKELENRNRLINIVKYTQKKN